MRRPELSDAELAAIAALIVLCIIIAIYVFSPPTPMLVK